MKIIVINGPNLNMLGKRDADHYGSLSLDSIKGILEKEFADISFEFFQSNMEGEIIDKIQAADKKYDGILINPGGYAHTSVAIRDALAECKVPKIEVHLSHLANREEFRQKLITASGCSGYISGFKEKSYSAGVYLLKKLIKEEGL
jgi:3-dehydroquinate dehydratase-2